MKEEGGGRRRWSAKVTAEMQADEQEQVEVRGRPGPPRVPKPSQAERSQVSSGGVSSSRASSSFVESGPAEVEVHAVVVVEEVVEVAEEVRMAEERVQAEVDEEVRVEGLVKSSQVKSGQVKSSQAAVDEEVRVEGRRTDPDPSERDPQDTSSFVESDPDPIERDPQDTRAWELERRVILSTYLTRVHCAGASPPHPPPQTPARD